MIQRARLFFVVALLIAAGILVTNLPLGSLMRDRATIAAESGQLATLRTGNRLLSAEVRALNDPATVARIAHEEYGLVKPGQTSVVVLPPAGRSAGTRNPLVNGPIPAADLLPSDAVLVPSVPPPTKGAGFWRRVLDRLEFWHSLF